MVTAQMMVDLALPPSAGGQDARLDARLDAPAFHRNGLPIVEALSPRLSRARGHVLEVGSGSGQHVALLSRAFPQLTFWPSDPNPAHRASIDAWRAHLGLETVRPAIDLDARAPEWTITAENPDLGLHAILCANVVHIAPWPVAEGLFLGAARMLQPEGFLALYGPFRWSGAHVSDSNQVFDASLRARDPEWGVRDIDDIDLLANACHLARIETIATPANNHLLVFSRKAA